MTEKNHRHTIDILFVLILFCVFALSVIALTGTGAGVYSKIVNSMGTNYNSRTATAYISGKMHRYDTANCIELGSFGDSDALLLLEDIDNTTYCTYIYYYDGAIMELFTRYGQTIGPEFGTKIMNSEVFDITKISDSLYGFKFSKEGGLEDLYVHIRSSEANTNE